LLFERLTSGRYTEIKEFRVASELPQASMRSHRRIFTTSITYISRMLILRDRLLGRIRRGSIHDSPGAEVSRHSIPSGDNVLDAVLVKPADGAPKTVVLICHGIGEVVERWFPVQQLLAANGAASLVFDYSGYGRSTGAVSVSQCELDAISAFEELERLMPGYPVSIVGFSLGSGIAAAIVNKVKAHRLVLCAAFTSLRAAACSGGLPKSLAFTMPHVWRTEESLIDCNVPVLIVHGEKDRLFPVWMASELAARCHENCELVMVPKLAHNEPFFRPTLEYWSLILSRLNPEEQKQPTPQK